MDIIIDSREQKPLFKNNKFDTLEIKSLKTGDYSIKNLEDKISIERKSLGDLFGTLGKGHKRFKKELERAQKLDYFAIVIEGCYSRILTKDFDGSYHSKMKGYVITSILFTLHVKYNINVFFANNRNEAKKIIKEIFKAYIKKNNRGDKDGKISRTSST